MKILFLDDDLDRHSKFTEASAGSEVTFVHSVAQAVEALTTEQFDIAFLDHDLDGRVFVEEVEGTGTQVAEYIAGMPCETRPRIVIVHSMNPYGAQRMMNILRACPGRLMAWQTPFGTQEFYGYIPAVSESAQV
jgi:hypothetical protein